MMVAKTTDTCKNAVQHIQQKQRGPELQTIKVFNEFDAMQNKEPKKMKDKYF